jgi:hypothetical protein
MTPAVLRGMIGSFDPGFGIGRFAPMYREGAAKPEELNSETGLRLWKQRRSVYLFLGLHLFDNMIFYIDSR